MRIEPKGILADLLTKHGYGTSPFEVDDDVLERFLVEVRNSQMFIEDREVVTEEERQALAVFMARTHPGWGKTRLQAAVSLVDSVPFSEAPEQAKPQVSAVTTSTTTPSQWPVWAWRGAVLVLLVANVVATLTR